MYIDWMNEAIQALSGQVFYIRRNGGTDDTEKCPTVKGRMEVRLTPGREIIETGRSSVLGWRVKATLNVGD